MRSTSYHPQPRHVPGILFAEDFDLDPGFDSEPVGDSLPEMALPPTPSFSADDLEQACIAARLDARRDALQEAEAQHRLACRTALQQIAQNFQAAEAAAGQVMEQSVDAAARLIFTCLLTLLPETCARHEASEILMLVRRLMASLSPVPVVDIAVAPALEADLRATLQALPPEMRPAVRLVGQPGLPAGDARITWKTGAASRSRRHVLDGIEGVFRQLGLTTGQAADTPGVLASSLTKSMEAADA